MSYRCGYCKEAVPHGVPMKRHTIYRSVKPRTRYVPAFTADGRHCMRPVDEPARGEIASEVPVCEGCELLLKLVCRK